MPKLYARRGRSRRFRSSKSTSIGDRSMLHRVTMDNFFVPYVGKRPASVCINGHRLVILAHDKDTLEDDLDLLGADRVKSVKVGERKTEHERFIGKIARQVDGGVVIAPVGVGLRDVLRNLESELPWLH